VTNRTTIYLRPPDLDSIQSGRHTDYAHWHAFAAHCRSLARDGLQYRITLQPFAARPHILIEASGIIGRRKPPARSNGLPALVTEQQATKRLADAEALLKERRWDLARKWGWWRQETYQREYDPAAVKMRRTFGRWLAGRLARRCGCRGTRRDYEQTMDGLVPNLSDYKSADETFGRRIPRLSELPLHDRERRGWVRSIAQGLGVYWGWRTPKTEPDPGVPYALDSDDETPRLAPAAWVERFLARPGIQIELSELAAYRRAKVDVEYWREMLRLLEERK